MYLLIKLTTPTLLDNANLYHKKYSFRKYLYSTIFLRLLSRRDGEFTKKLASGVLDFFPKNG